MDLLEGSSKKIKKTKAQKIVLTLLIVSIILCIAIAATLFIMGYMNKEKPYTIAINGNKVSVGSLGLIQTQEGEKYLPIKNICNTFNYQYFNGEYNIAGEDTDKGYINNGKCIIQFFAESESIYKTEENGIKDYEYYNLEHKIVLYNDDLYINIKDLNVGMNLIQYYLEDNNQTVIISPEYWIESNEEFLTTNEYIVNDSKDNLRAMAYGYVIISNNGKYGVINLSKNEVIGNKYNTMKFIEFTKGFIVSNNDNKYGIINNSGKTEIELQYDNIEVLNYEPLLYKVKKIDSYGVMRQDGSLINKIAFEDIGYPKDESNNIYFTLIIPESENIPASIVVKKDRKYGLINLQTGEEFLPCTLEGIFLVVDKNTNDKYYVAEIEKGQVKTIQQYIDDINKITVNINR